MEPHLTKLNTPPVLETLTIKQDEHIFILNLIKDNDYIIFDIIEKDFPNVKYTKKLHFKEMKELHKIFYMFNSFDDFLDYIKSAFENKKLTIKKDNQQLILNISVEYLFKQQIIEIPLLGQQNNPPGISKEIYQEISLLKEKIQELEKYLNKNKDNNINTLFDKQNKEIRDLKEENILLKNEILILREEFLSMIEKQNSEYKDIKQEIINIKKNYEELRENIKIDDQEEILKINENYEKPKINIKREIPKHKEMNVLSAKNLRQYMDIGEVNNEIINVNSAIMKNEEFSMIKSAIESRVNCRIKKVKKLYHASVDGGESAIFHSKCDNIKNTLTVIESEGKKRFGGFTTKAWESKLAFKDDKWAFLFSLDKCQIYPYKNDGKAILCSKEYGPNFGINKFNLCTIGIKKNPIKYKQLCTYESDSNSYEFNGDNNGLSEDGKGKYIFAKDYEVFEIIFK